MLRRFTLAESSDGSEDWDLKEELIYRGGAMLARLRPTSSNPLETRVHYHLDHLGSARVLTDSAGSILFLRDYLPFGEALNPSSNDDGVFRFTSHERDSDGGVVGNFDLDYMHARYYSSRLGRFLSLDPAAADPKFPQSWNRYTYVLNSPTTLVDEYGLIANCTAVSEDNPYCVDSEAVEVVAKDPYNSWSLKERIAWHLSLNGGQPYPCVDYSCQVMASVAEAKEEVEGLEKGLEVFFNFGPLGGGPVKLGAMRFRAGKGAISGGVKGARNVLQDLLHIKSQKGLGDLLAGTRDEALAIGRAWVNGAGIRSLPKRKLKPGEIGFTDGNRTFRMKYKEKSGKWQANFLENFDPAGQSRPAEIRNIHMDILDMVGKP